MSDTPSPEDLELYIERVAPTLGMTPQELREIAIKKLESCTRGVEIFCETTKSHTFQNRTSIAEPRCVHKPETRRRNSIKNSDASFENAVRALEEYLSKID